jgi:hypothetical protein
MGRLTGSLQSAPRHDAHTVDRQTDTLAQVCASGVGGVETGGRRAGNLPRSSERAACRPLDRLGKGSVCRPEPSQADVRFGYCSRISDIGIALSFGSRGSCRGNHPSGSDVADQGCPPASFDSQNIRFIPDVALTEIPQRESEGNGRSRRRRAR